METQLLVVVMAAALLMALPGGAGGGTLLPEDTPVEGRQVTLRCRVQVPVAAVPGRPVCFQWMKNGRGLESTGSDTLTIYNASLLDEGIYNCQLKPDESFPEDYIERPYYNLVLKAPPIVSITQKSGDATHAVPEGSVLSLTCRVTNKPRPPVLEAGFTWSFHSHGGPGEEVLPEKRKDLTVQPVHRNHSGRYTCRASTDGDFYSGYRASTSSIHVHVLYLDSNLTILPKERLMVVAGDKVNLTCQADSLPTATLTWLHRGRVLHTVEGNEDVLSFTATGCQDSGELQCRADNAVLHKSRLAGTNLTVECPPSRPGSSNQSQVSALVGENLTLSIQASANPAPTYMWSGPGLSSGHRSSSVTLVSLKTKHSGLYNVTVSNRHGSFVHVFLVTVRPPAPPIVSITQKSGDATHTVPEGSVLSLTCRVTNKPRPPVLKAGFTWSFHSHGGPGEEVLPEKRKDLTVQAVHRSRSGPGEEVLPEKRKDLTVQPVHRNHSGRYTCRASTDGDFYSGYRASTSSIHVQVLYLDSNLTLLPKERLTVVAGDEVNLTCQADSLPTATLTWVHQGRVLHTVEGNEDVLSFTATGCQDSGELQCRADNAVLHKSRLAGTNLTVECPPSRPGSSNQSQASALVGENLTLSIQASANPAPTYTWSGPGLSSGHWSSSLTLVSLETKHSGQYNVFVSNRHGSFVHAFLVTVRPPEGLPQGAQLGLTVGGGVMASLLCLLFFCLFWQRKTLLCCKVKGGNSASKRHEHQDLELEAGGRSPRAGREGRRGEELEADSSSEDSTGHYCRIDSADLDLQPQPVPPRHSGTRDLPEHSYDVPLPAVRGTSPGTCVSRDQEPLTAVDVVATDDVTGEIPEDESVRGDSPVCIDISVCADSDQVSEDSQCYLACHVISHGLPPCSLASQSPGPQDDYLTPLHLDRSGGRGSVPGDVTDYVFPDLD